MSENARTVFNIEEQKAKDVMAAIKAVQPVLSLIREWGKKEQEYKQLSEDNKKLSEEISSVKHTVRLTINGSDLERQLTIILKDKSSEYEKSKKREEELKCIYDNMGKEVTLYQEYANMFNWIDKSIIEKVLNLSNFEDKEEYLSMMFLFLNAGISDYYLEPLNCFMFKEGYYLNCFMSSGAWNWMLNKLLLNEL